MLLLIPFVTLPNRDTAYDITIVFIELNKRVTKPPTVLKIKLPKISNDSITHTIFGTNANVCSLICVVAWNIDTKRPTTIAMINMGAAHSTTVVIACVSMFITSPCEITVLTSSLFLQGDIIYVSICPRRSAPHPSVECLYQ